MVAGEPATVSVDSTGGVDPASVITVAPLPDSRAPRSATTVSKPSGRAATDQLDTTANVKWRRLQSLRRRTTIGAVTTARRWGPAGGGRPMGRTGERTRAGAGAARDVGELAADPRAPGIRAVGVEAEASSRPGSGAAVTGPDVEPDIVPTAGSGVQVVAVADRSRAFTASPPAGLVAGA